MPENYSPDVGAIADTGATPPNPFIGAASERSQQPPPARENVKVRSLWGQMMQSMSEQIRSGGGVAASWIEPQPENPVAPGVEGDPSMPGDIGIPSSGEIQFSGSAEADQFIAAAQQYVGTPYVWGGANPSGFDCSGLIQFAARQVGVVLPRVSRDQARVGTEVAVEQAQPGDLIAFPARGLEVGHIGIVVGRNENGQLMMLHAPRSGQNVKVEAVGNRTVATVRRVFNAAQSEAFSAGPSPQGRSIDVSTRPSEVVAQNRGL